MSITEEIKEKINILPLVQEYVELRKSGTNWKGLCPFHRERTPSFTVNEERQMVHCFGCGVSGDVFTFVMEMENTDFKGALSILGAKSGVKVPDEFEGLGGREKSRLISLMNNAARFFVEMLPKSKEATEYVEKRIGNGEIAEEFQIGYAPNDGRLLIQKLLDFGFYPYEMFKAGITYSETDPWSNRFTGRLMFPIHNNLGEVVAFSARTIFNKGAKYINSPETDLYKKGNVLYNLNRARKFTKKSRKVILVEGNMDVISLYKHGVESCVAPCGTALTREQVEKLKRIADDVYIMFDTDDAGIAAMKKNSELCLESSLHPYIVDLSKFNVKDVDDFLKRYSVKDLAAHMSISKPYIEYLLETLVLDDMGIQTKKVGIEKFMQALTKLNSTIERQQYLKLLSEKIKVEENIIIKDFKIYETKSHKKEKPLGYLGTQETIFAIYLSYPGVIEELGMTSYIEERKELLERYNIDQTKRTNLLLQAEEKNVITSEEMARAALIEKKFRLLQREMKDLVEKMQLAENEKDAALWQSLYTKFMHVKTSLLLVTTPER